MQPTTLTESQLEQALELFDKLEASLDRHSYMYNQAEVKQIISELRATLKLNAP